MDRRTFILTSLGTAVASRLPKALPADTSIGAVGMVPVLLVGDYPLKVAIARTPYRLIGSLSDCCTAWVHTQRGSVADPMLEGTTYCTHCLQHCGISVSFYRYLSAPDLIVNYI
jgi:hypothetical protein